MSAANPDAAFLPFTYTSLPAGPCNSPFTWSFLKPKLIMTSMAFVSSPIASQSGSREVMEGSIDSSSPAADDSVHVSARRKPWWCLGAFQASVNVTKWVFRGQGLASGACCEINQLCDLGQISTLSGLQFPITHFSIQVSTYSCHALCPGS